MAEGDQGEDRTETATTRHLDHAREEGQVPMSREMTTFAGLLAAMLVLGLQSQSMMQRLLPYLVAYLSRTGDGAMLGSARMQVSFAGVMIAIAPMLLAATVAGAAAVLLQTNFLLHLGGLTPKISRKAGVWL
jgi:flagellar biosynthetic protein FlhB